MAKDQNYFGHLLQQAREAKGLSQSALAQCVGLDVSYIYRIEKADRRPSRATALSLAEALGVGGEALNHWLITAGHAPMPLLTRLGGALGTRGRGRHSSAGILPSTERNADYWATWLEAMGLEDGKIRRLLRVMETSKLSQRLEAARAVSNTLSRVADMLEAPVHTAVIPAAGKEHRLVALHVMQYLLLGAINEAVESGISNIVLVLAPGSVESLYKPLKEALALAAAPPIKLHFCEQAEPEGGLGDAVLRAEAFIDTEPFAVLLPDDVVRERMGCTARPRELYRMMTTFTQLSSAHLVAVTAVPTSKMSQYGVVLIGNKEVMPKIFPITHFVEKPAPTDPICRSPRALGIVGRYLLHPTIFGPLRELKDKGKRPVHLTDALEKLHQAGHSIYSFELKAGRQDIGEVLGQAGKLIEDSSDLSPASRARKTLPDKGPKGVSS